MKEELKPGIPGTSTGFNDKRRFADKFIASLRKAGIPGPFGVDCERFQIAMGAKGENGTLGLANAYKAYCAAPVEERPTIIEAYVLAAVNTPDVCGGWKPWRRAVEKRSAGGTVAYR